MPINCPIQTKNYRVIVLHKKGYFIIEHTHTGKQSKLYMGFGFKEAYETLRDTFNFNNDIFDNLCKMELES